MNLKYIFARGVRHFMPDVWARFLLRRGLITRPGQETSDPQSALWRYQEILASRGTSFSGKRVLVFGYGGSFAVGCGLLENGGRHGVLGDKYAPPQDRLNVSSVINRPAVTTKNSEVFLAWMEKEGLGSLIRRSIAPQTLKAWVDERTEANLPLPPETLMTVFHEETAKITRAPVSI